MQSQSNNYFLSNIWNFTFQDYEPNNRVTNVPVTPGGEKMQKQVTW